jgi:hypothetical protein
MMDLQQKEHGVVEQNQVGALKRRRLIAGAAALVAGVFAHAASQQVDAANGDPLKVGQATTTQLQTSLSVAPNPPSTTPVSPPVSPAFFVYNSTTGVGIRTQTSGYAGTIDTQLDGVQAFSVGSNNAALAGRNDDLNAVGVYGVATNGTGVAGQSYGGSAVFGGSASGAGGYFSSGSGNGLFAQSTSGYGIVSSSANNPAVYAASTNSIGVQGIGNGAQPYGVVGATTTNGGFGLLGQASAPGSVAFGGTGYGSALAGQFIGAVTHYGQISLQQQTQPPSGTVNAFVVGPGVTKNAAVPHPDGSLRLMHCVEAPEPWFEDFGDGKVTAGKSDVQIDPDFAAVVDMSKAHIFLTETGGHNGLHVVGHTASSFTVAASPVLAKAAGVALTSVSSTFSYRVVAKRKDVSGERLAKFTFPAKVDVKEIKATNPLAPPDPGRRPDGKSSRQK